MATSTLGNGTLVLAGTTSGTTTVTATAVAGTTTLTLPAATDTLVGKATTDTLTNKTLTGAAMNGTLGATTPSTVAATTLTTSSTVTHNGGTANGVGYLDGSKVLTTGSALVFDGTNLGVGVTPSAWGSGYSAFEMPGGNHLMAATGLMQFGANAYWSGSAYIYKANGPAGRYNITNNAGNISHAWSTAPSGTAGNAITFTQAMTLDTSGNLLVGTTTSDARIRVSGGGTVGRFVADGGSYTGNIISADTSGTAAGTGFNLILLQAGGANQFRVRGDGTIYAQNTTVQNISDRRIKENIVDAQDGLNVVTNLRPVRFDFKENFGNNRKNQLGFIAQEIEQVFPEAVDIWGESDDPANPYKSVGSGALIPVLVKAIQEQQALITTLTARITALESA